MAAECDYIMVNKTTSSQQVASPLKQDWYKILYSAKILEWLIFSRWSLKMLLDSNILAVEHNTGCYVT